MRQVKSGTGWALLLVGLACLYGAMAPVVQLLDTRDYRTVTGRVERTEIAMRKIGTTGRVRWFARVRYGYTVDGTRLMGERIGTSFDFGRNDSAEAATILSRFPVGAAVPVHYDPADPATAVLLTRQLTPFQILLLSTGILVTLAGTLALTVFRWRTPLPR